jgi:RimJ/RimL family protein N-acetyltransferase
MNILAKSANIIIRDYESTDVDIYLKWMVSGQWLKTDAPWKREGKNTPDLIKIRDTFIEKFITDLQSPRKRALVATADNFPIGRLNRYSHNSSEDAWLLGIAICEDEYLGKGFGIEILRLWIDYLFRNSSFHRLGLETWLFNKIMIRIAEKAGFVLEGTQREVMNWQGEWLDLLNYGMLREEWENHRQDKT